jgi:hypothetical protein
MATFRVELRSKNLADTFGRGVESMKLGRTVDFERPVLTVVRACRDE